MQPLNACIRYLYILLNNTLFNAKNQAFAGLGSGEVEKELVGLLKRFGQKTAKTGQKTKEIHKIFDFSSKNTQPIEFIEVFLISCLLQISVGI